MKSHKKQLGYTLPELLIVISVSGVILSTVLVFAIGYSRFASSLQMVSDTFVDRLNISDYFRDKLGSSSGLISQNSLQDVNAGKPDTSLSPAYYWEKLHAIPKIINNGSGGSITPNKQPRAYARGIA